MNPDPNQPAQPQPEQPTQPTEPVQFTVPVPVPIPEVPAPYAPAPVVVPAVPNPFSAAPVSSDVPVNPFAQPVAPVVIGSSPNSDPLPSPAGKSKKKLIILLSAIVGGLIILGGAALAVYFIFFSVSKADYQKAFDQATTVQKKLSSNSVISSGSSKESIAAAKTDYADFKTENAKLADLKAIKNDKDIHAKYVTYDAKAKSFISFMDGFLPSYEKFATASDQISALGTGSSSFTSANIQKTIDLLKGVADITDPTLKTFLDAAIASYTEMLPQVKIYESSSSTSSQKYAAINAVSDSYDKISAASSTMSDAMNKQTKDVDPSDALNDLGKTITTKLNAAK